MTHNLYDAMARQIADGIVHDVRDRAKADKSWFVTAAWREAGDIVGSEFRYVPSRIWGTFLMLFHAKTMKWMGR